MLVQSLTKDRMLAIEAASIVNGYIDGSGHLILVQHDGTEIDAGDALLAVANASTTQVGVVELATTAETNAGTDTVRAVTPASLTNILSRVAALELVGVDLIAPLAQSAAITSYPKGVSLMEVGAGSGWTPNGGFGLVVTYYSSATRTSQSFYANQNDKEWRRYYYFDLVGGWGPWRFQGTEESLDAASFSQTTAVSAYPEGTSHMWITSTQATAGGWSWGAQFGTLHTTRPWGTTDAQQIWQMGGGTSIISTLWVRTGNSGGWGVWKQMARVQDYVDADTVVSNTLGARITTLESVKTKCGTEAVTVSGTSVVKHVNFPAAFPGKPKMTPPNIDSAPGATSGWSGRMINITASGFDIFLYGASASFTVDVDWFAIYP